MRVTSDDSTDIGQLLARRAAVWSRYAVLLTGSVSEAQDLVQEAIVRMLESPDRFTHAEHPDAYTKRVLTNIFLNNHRRQLHLQQLLPRIAASASGAIPDASDAQADR